jgi:hypothetical protein
MVLQIRQQELDYRKQLYALGLKTSERLPLPEVNIKRRKARQAREEEADYECEICRANLFVSLVSWIVNLEVMMISLYVLWEIKSKVVRWAGCEARIGIFENKTQFLSEISREELQLKG